MSAGVQVEGYRFDEEALSTCPDHAAVLGRIFTSWSLIEATIAGLLGLMMHADERAAVAILETFQSNNGRVQAVRKVGKEMLDPSKLPEFEAVMRDVLAYATERNSIAHCLWGANEAEPDKVYRMPMKRFSEFMVKIPHIKQVDSEGILASFKKAMTPFTVAELEAIEQRGRDVLHRAMRLANQASYDRAVLEKNPNVISRA